MIDRIVDKYPVVRFIPDRRITETGEAVRFVLEQAELDGLDHEIPRRSDEKWERNKEITRRYLEEGQSSRKVAEDFGIRRQRVQQIAASTFLKYLRRSLLDVREAVHPNAIKKLKQGSLQESFRISLSKGGRLQEFVDEAKRHRSYGQLKEAGFTQKQLHQYRRSLRRFGIDIPYKDSIPGALQLANNLASAQTDEQKQEYLNKVDRDFYDYHSRNSLSILLPLSHIPAGMGLSQNPRKLNLVAELVQSQKIPYTKFSNETPKREFVYHVICSEDFSRVQNVLLENPQLLKILENPVKHFAGPEVPLPTTTKLSKKDGYTTTGNMSKELSIRSDQIAHLIGPDCPVTVLRWRDGIFLKTEDYPLFKQHVQGNIALKQARN